MKKAAVTTLQSTLQPIGANVTLAEQVLKEAQAAATTARENRRNVLRSLARSLGFNSNAELVEELRGLSAKEPTGTAVQAGSAAVQAGEVAAPKPAGKRHRQKITDEIRTRTIALLKQSKTANAVSAAVGISVASVSKIKKAAGLTHSNAPKAAAAPKAAKTRKAAAAS